MIPTPEYIKKYALGEKQKGLKLSFGIKCSCGCEKFLIKKMNYTDEEKLIIKEYEDKFPDTGWHTIYGGIDSNGKHYAYIKILGIFKKYITFPKPPIFIDFNILKAICSQCNQEITLFDSRFHGYDGMISTDTEAKEYIPHFKLINNKLYSIKIEIENENDLESFVEVTGEECSSEFYSNAFGWIRISGIDVNGKKTILLELEIA